MVLIATFNAPYNQYTDEGDTLLGGHVIAHGGVLYRDYASQHMPLSYYLAALCTLVAKTNLIGLKVLWGVAIAIWILGMSRHLAKAYGPWVAVAFVTLVIASQPLTWGHMILPEAIVGYCTAHLLILFVTRDRRILRVPELVTWAVLIAAIPLSSAVFIPLAAGLYILRLWRIGTAERGSLPLGDAFRRRTRYIVLGTVFAILPYLVVIVYFAANHALSDFHFWAFTFNTDYYSKFTSDSPTSTADSFFAILQAPTQSALAVISGVFDTPNMNWLPLLFLLTGAVTIYVAVRRKRIADGLAIALALVGTSTRSGTFQGTFGQAHGTIAAAIVEILVACVALTFIVSARSGERDRDGTGVMKVLAGLAIVVLAITSIAQMSTDGRSYLQRNELVNTALPDSTANIVNTVNTSSKDTYWIAPFDTFGVLFIKSQNVSNSYGWVPWSEACAKCKAEQMNALQTKKPNVLVLTSGSIWNVPTSTFMAPMIAFAKQYYYQYTDPRLGDAYFLMTNMEQNTARLKAAGYSTTLSPLAAVHGATLSTVCPGSPNTTINGLADGATLTQSFTSSLSELDGLQVEIGTYARKSSGTLQVELQSSAGKKLATASVNLADVPDNSTATFVFPKVTNAKGKVFTARFTTSGTPTSKSIGLYSFTKNCAPNAKTTFAGHKVTGDLGLSYYGK